VFDTDTRTPMLQTCRWVSRRILPPGRRPACLTSRFFLLPPLSQILHPNHPTKSPIVDLTPIYMYLMILASYSQI
jgi:hypothetical protein